MNPARKVRILARRRGRKCVYRQASNTAEAVDSFDRTIQIILSDKKKAIRFLNGLEAYDETGKLTPLFADGKR